MSEEKKKAEAITINQKHYGTIEVDHQDVENAITIKNGGGWKTIIEPENIPALIQSLLPENKEVKSAEEILDEEISDSLKNILEQSDTPEDLRSFRRYILNAMERYKSQPALPTKEKEGFPINDAVNSMMGNNAPTNKQE